MKNCPDKWLSPKIACSLDSQYSQLWLSVLHLWCLVAVYLYIPERRDILEEGWTRIVRIVQGT